MNTLIDIISRSQKGQKLTPAEQLFTQSLMTAIINFMAGSGGTAILAFLSSGKLTYQEILLGLLVGVLSILGHAIARYLLAKGKTDNNVLEEAAGQALDAGATQLDKKFPDLEKGVDPVLQNSAILKAINMQAQTLAVVADTALTEVNTALTGSPVQEVTSQDTMPHTTVATATTGVLPSPTGQPEFTGN